MDIPITFSPDELALARFVGEYRNKQAVNREYRPRYGSPSNQTATLRLNWIGALGECAVAKYLDKFWTPGDIGTPDVWKYEVRSTHHHHGRLILHPGDADDRVFWLVCGVHPDPAKADIRIKGWILCREGKQQQFWTDPQPGRFAFFVPQQHLNHPKDFSNA